MMKKYYKFLDMLKFVLYNKHAVPAQCRPLPSRPLHGADVAFRAPGQCTGSVLTVLSVLAPALGEI